MSQLKWIPAVLSSEVAVKAFFVVSGFLIFMSFERSGSLASYVGKRVRRIYPAYFVVVLLCAISLVMVSSASVEDYFSASWVKYLAANLVFLNFLQPALPGVFELNRLDAVNGALWTLKIEVMFYLSVPVLVFLFRRFSHLAVILAVYGLSVLYSELMLSLSASSPFYGQLARQLPGQLSYFMAGAFFYYFLDLFEKRVVYFVLPASLILVVDEYYSLPLFEPFALATIVVFFGLFLYLGNFGKFGDFSYGVYILHFPIIQIFVHLDYFQDSPVVFLGSVVLVTTVGAIVMWNVVEKRFLLRANHYVTVEKYP